MAIRSFSSQSKYSFYSMEIFLLVNKTFCRFKDRFFCQRKLRKILLAVLRNFVLMPHKTIFFSDNKY